MPVSHYKIIPAVMTQAESLGRGQVSSILDVGSGFGKYGVLLRERFDVRFKRVLPSEWKTIIDCVEFWKPYISPLHEYIYNTIYNGDIYNLVHRLPSYDLILMLECLEHMSKHKGKIVINNLWKKANKLFIVSFPQIFKGGENADWVNPREEHRCLWTKPELDEIIGETTQVTPTIFVKKKI